MRMGAVWVAILVGSAFGVLGNTAQAQWMWKDDAGHTVVSDQPPPTSVPESRILKSPSGHPMAAPAPLDSSGGAADASKPKSLSDQDFEFKKRQKEAAEAAKKQQDKDAQDRQMAQRCQALRASLSSLQSGVRIARTDDKGQRYFVDDAQRASEAQQVQADIGTTCQ